DPRGRLPGVRRQAGRPGRAVLGDPARRVVAARRRTRDGAGSLRRRRRGLSLGPGRQDFAFDTERSASRLSSPASARALSDLRSASAAATRCLYSALASRLAFLLASSAAAAPLNATARVAEARMAAVFLRFIMRVSFRLSF